MESFRQWLKNQKHRSDPVGDLARDTADDEDLKGVRLSPTHLKDHIILAGGCQGAIDACGRAASEFQSQKA